MTHNASVAASCVPQDQVRSSRGSGKFGGIVEATYVGGNRPAKCVGETRHRLPDRAGLDWRARQSLLPHWASSDRSDPLRPLVPNVLHAVYAFQLVNSPFHRSEQAIALEIAPDLRFELLQKVHQTGWGRLRNRKFVAEGIPNVATVCGNTRGSAYLQMPCYIRCLNGAPQVLGVYATTDLPRPARSEKRSDRVADERS
jgi:hypothetical protein